MAGDHAFIPPQDKTGNRAGSSKVFPVMLQIGSGRCRIVAAPRRDNFRIAGRPFIFGHGFPTRLSYLPALKNMNNLVLMIIVSVVGVLLSQFGFSDLVGQVYPILGFGGLVVMAIMIWVAWLRIWGPNKDAQPLAA